MYSFIMIKPGRTARSVAPRRQAGVTIVEVMVSVLIGLILLAAIVQVFINSKQNYAFQVALNEMNESIRFASGQLEYHLRMAGYWGGAAQDPKMISGTTWNDYIGNCDDNLPGISPSDARIPSLYFVSRANLDPGSACVARSKVGRRSDTLAVSYADPSSFPSPLPSPPPPKQGDPYLQVNVGGSAMLYKWSLPAGTIPPDSSDPAVTYHPFHYYYYFISDCLADTVAVMGSGGPCPAADTDDHPWLRRLLYSVQGNTMERYRIESITPGVEHMTFILLVDQTGDGDTVNFMMADDVRSSTTLGDNPWESVRAVQYQLLIRTTQRDVNAFADTQTYTLLNGQNALIDATTNEHLYPRRLVTGMVQLRNNAAAL